MGEGDYPGIDEPEPVSWSHAPQLIGRYSSGSFWCLVGMIFVFGFALSPVIAILEAWFTGLSVMAKGALIGIIIAAIIEGAKWIYPLGR
ncbi:MAG: hypothetical protein HXS46_19855 [Theionarchaea archaeon]|nr:hypothetical protein [Theionarchaea archaeon]